MDTERNRARGGVPRRAPRRSGNDASAENWSLEELHRAFYEDLGRFVGRRIRDPELARDIVQETFIRVYLARNGCAKEKPAWPWLATIARNVMSNTFRAEHRHRFVASSSADWSALVRAADPSSDVDPELRFTTALQKAAIERAMQSLPARQRRALILRCGYGLRYDEIAAVEGISRDAVKSLIKRARRAFRETYASIDREAS